MDAGHPDFIGTQRPIVQHADVLLLSPQRMPQRALAKKLSVPELIVELMHRPAPPPPQHFPAGHPIINYAAAASTETM